MAIVISVLSVELAICKLARNAVIQQWYLTGEFACIVRTSSELSLVCDAAAVPPDIHGDAGWRAVKLEGPFDLTEIGILAPIATLLASARIPIFVIATYETDYILVPEKQLGATLTLLHEYGYRSNSSHE